MTPRSPIVSAPLFVGSVLLFAGCAEDKADSSACGAPLTCADFSGSAGIGTYEEGSDAGLFPADFPAAPGTATLCGAVTYSTGSDTSAGTVYYLNTGADADLWAAYEGSLAAAGYTLGESAPVEDGVGCHESASVTGGDLLPTAALFVYGGQGGFALGPFAAP